MRPESGRRVVKPSRRVAANRVPPNFQIEEKGKGEISSKSGPASSSKWAILAALALIVLVFGVCMAIYLLHSLPSEGLHLILLGLTAAFISDLISQMAMLTVLAARQLCYDMRSRNLPLNTVKLR